MAAGRDVEVVGHRGASADVPEHTLDAYRHAVRIGADAVECDVRMTRDGVLVCVHDRRVDQTSTGRGVVSTLTLADLDQLSFGARAAVRAPSWVPVTSLEPDDEPDRSSRGVLTLHKLLEYVTSGVGDVRLAIETKHPTRYSARVERTLLDDLARFGLLRDGVPVERGGRPGVRLMSFSPAALRRVQLMAPQLPTVHLFRRLPSPAGMLAVSGAVTAVGPSLVVLRRHPGLVRTLQRAGTQVHVWTVNEDDDMQYVLDLGVDAVITDRPAALLDRLGRGSAA